MHWQVFLRLEKAEKDKLDAQTAAMSAARSMAEPGAISADQRRLVMDLYRLTATLKVCCCLIAVTLLKCLFPKSH